MSEEEELAELKRKLAFLTRETRAKKSQWDINGAVDNVGRYFLEPLAALTNLVNTLAIGCKKPICPSGATWQKYFALAMSEEEGRALVGHYSGCRPCKLRERFITKLLSAKIRADRINKDSANLLYGGLWRLSEKVIDSVTFAEEK